MFILKNCRTNSNIAIFLFKNRPNMKRKCILQPMNPINTVPITLPDKEIIHIGRSRNTLIRDLSISKQQFRLTADYEKEVVECVSVGINPSGCNGYALMKNGIYNFKDGDLLEMTLGKYIYEIKFHTDEDVVPEKKIKLDLKSRDLPKSFQGNWQFIDNSLLIYTPDIDLSGNYVASFDLDGTLITTKSGQKFPKDKNDWKLLFANIHEKFKDLYEKGYRIVLFSNQLKLGQEKQMISGFKEKIEAILKKINIPIQVFLATQKDIYRKPTLGMWNSLIESIDHEIDLNKSFYVGDAAGREKNWAPHKSKDHSNSDRLYSLNLGIKFYTPEEYFLGAKTVSHTMPEFDPRTVSSLIERVPTNSEHEGIIMVGCQGSGKSHFCKNHIVPLGYVYINRDTLGSKQKCLNLVEECLKTKKSFVIDNTNPDIEARKPFIDLCKKYKIPIKCFLMETSHKHCKHNNKFRSLTDKKHIPVADIIINSYRKKFKEPTLSEGISEIHKFQFNAKFEDENEEKLYKMFLLES